MLFKLVKVASIT